MNSGERLAMSSKRKHNEATLSEVAVTQRLSLYQPAA